MPSIRTSKGLLLIATALFVGSFGIHGTASAASTNKQAQMNNSQASSGLLKWPSMKTIPTGSDDNTDSDQSAAPVQPSTSADETDQGPVTTPAKPSQTSNNTSKQQLTESANTSDSSANDSSASSGNDNTSNSSGNDNSSGSPAASSDVEKVIAKGMTYLGTPYEFGSDRSTSSTFDCSDFVHWIFEKALDVKLPSDSRGQGAYVKEHSTVTTDWKKLKRGDLMFFMSYEGSHASDYAKVNKSEARITHVAIYLGDGQVLQTYSKDSGGVRTDDIEGTQWAYRFLFGGSALS